MNNTSSRGFTRRRFLKRTCALGAAVLAAPTVVPSGVMGLQGRPGPNEKIGLGFIGSGHRARLLMSQIPAGGEIRAICDVNLKCCEEALKEQQAKWPVHQSYHKLLELKEVEAVVVPTTDHGRVLPCIHAAQSGRDIYAEKPLTLYVREGRALVNAVRKYGRVFQVGTQQRSMEMNRFACELVRTGGIGKLEGVLAVNYGGSDACGSLPQEPMPEGLDWDMWCGSTELAPYNSRKHRGWMGCREYSGGEMTNWGAHGIDQIQWALGMDATGPVEFWPESPGTAGKVSFRYANGVTVKLELAGAPMGGAVFLGEKGKVEIDRNRFAATPGELVKNPPEPQKAEIWEGPGWQAKFHIQNWLDCIKTREKPVADVEIGHRTISVCHIVNITRQLNRKLRWDPVKEVFLDDKEANALLDRPRRKGYELPDLA